MAGALRLADAFPESADAARALRDAGLRVAVAESCTGGLLGAVLTALPGSSAYLRGGVVAYSDDVKESLLDVPAELLRRVGAVSPEAARAMAAGVRRRLDAELGIAVTGVAGPDGGSAKKPVGLVFVAGAGPGREEVVTLRDDLGREPNRERAVREALLLCVRLAR